MGCLVGFGAALEFFRPESVSKCCSRTARKMTHYSGSDRVRRTIRFIRCEDNFCALRHFAQVGDKTSSIEINNGFPPPRPCRNWLSNHTRFKSLFFGHGHTGDLLHFPVQHASPILIEARAPSYMLFGLRTSLKSSDGLQPAHPPRSTHPTGHGPLFMVSGCPGGA